jgi:sporulation protein YlmC with PRC-barrel domain
MRRAVGRDLGLAFVPVDQILALDADIVMVQAGRSRRLGLSGSPRATRWPQLRLVQGFAVVTMWGQRLGRLVDLVLDPSGRRVTGYLINPSTDAPRPVQPGLRPLLTSRRTPEKPSKGTRTPEPEPEPQSQSQSQSQSERAPSSLLVVPTSAHVRVGRDLIVVGEPSAARPGGRGQGVRVVDAGAPEWPAVPDLPSAGSDGAADQDWGHHTDMRYPPDTPTEAL